MLYRTSQCTKLSDVWCFEVSTITEDHCKRNGAKRRGWRDMQINVPFPLESTHLGYSARRVLLVLSFCTQGDLSKSEHMLG